MKLGVSYNVWDSEELLLSSIEQIKSQVDFIAVVAQVKSNHGEDCNPSLIPYLEYLKAGKYIDQVIIYEPRIAENSDLSCHWNEIQKRAVGRAACIDAGCTHFLSMDCDEFYRPEDFKRAKRKIEKKGFDTTALYIQDYHYRPIYQVKGLANYYVPFIHSISCDYRINAPYFKYVDPTRGIYNYSNPYLFREDEIVMHHMTTVRLDLGKKYRNSSARMNIEDIELKVEKIKKYDIINSTEPQCIETTDIFKIEEGLNIYESNWLRG